VYLRSILLCLFAAALLSACGGSRSHGLTAIGAGIRGPSGLKAMIYTRDLPHVSAFAYDHAGRLWATTSGSTSHTSDGVYLVSQPGAAARKVVGGIEGPLGLVWVGDRLIVSSLGRVTEYAGFDGVSFRRSKDILSGPVPGGENNNVVLAPDGRLVMGISASCDHCVPASKWSGTILSFRQNGSDLRVLAKGVRAAYGLAYLPGTKQLFASLNQRDDLGSHTPGDWLAIVRSGQDWGFPGCYGQRTKACSRRPAPVGVLDAHAAAGGVALLTLELAGRYRPSALVAEWQLGKIQRVALRRTSGGYSGTTSVFLTGFENPLPVISTRNGSILVGDWGTGIVYRISAS